MKGDFCPRKIKPKNCSYGKILLALVVFTVAAGYYFLNRNYYDGYTGWQPCQNLTKSQMDQLLHFSYNVHQLLDELGLEHWLMYGSLVGALRLQAPLAWDKDIDIGLDGDGRLKELGKTKFFENLKSVGAKKITDNWSRDGLIKIYNENSGFSVDLIIYHRSENWMKRPGWASRLFYLHCNNSHKFPTKLIEQPLPKAQFGFFSISVPRNGSEMLKYNYPPDWLKVVQHLQC